MAIGDVVGGSGFVDDVEVVPTEELEGEELQAAKPSAPATARTTSRRPDRAEGRGMGIRMGRRR
jgi:hypothetical protein